MIVWIDIAIRRWSDRFVVVAGGTGGGTIFHTFRSLSIVNRRNRLPALVVSTSRVVPHRSLHFTVVVPAIWSQSNAKGPLRCIVCTGALCQI